MNNNKYKEIYNYESDFDVNASWSALESKLEQKKRRRGLLWFYWGAGMLSIVLFSGFLITSEYPQLSQNDTDKREIEIENQGPKNNSEVVRTLEQNQSFNLTTTLSKDVSADHSNATNGRINDVDASLDQGDLISNPSSTKIKESNTNPPKIKKQISPTDEANTNDALSDQPIFAVEKVEDDEDNSTEETSSPNFIVSQSGLLTSIGMLPPQVISPTNNRYTIYQNIIVPEVSQDISNKRLGLDFMVGMNFRSLKSNIENNDYVALREANESILESRKARLTYDHMISNKWFVRGAIDYTEINEKFTFNGVVDIYEEVTTEDIYTDHMGNVSALTNTSSEFKKLDIDIVKFNKITSLNLPISIGYVFNESNFKWSAISGLTLPIVSQYRGRIFNEFSEPITLAEVPSIAYSKRPKVHHGVEASYPFTPQFNVRFGAHIEYDLQKRISLLNVDQRYCSFFLLLGVSYNL